MPLSNGTTNPDNYLVGRGRLYLATLSSGRPDGNGWRDLGNCPEFNVQVESETLEHYSSREGLKTLDAEIVLSQKVTITFKLEELDDDNKALFFSGSATAAALTNPAVAGVTNIVLTAALKKGRWYDLTSLASGAGVRAYDIDKTKLSVREDPDASAAGPTTLVQDTDYTVDQKHGRIYIEPAGAANEGQDMDFTLAADAGAVAPVEVKALTQTSVSCALKFISVNPNNGDFEEEWQFHQVTLKADGDLGLISEDIAKMGFRAVAERNETLDPDSPTLTIRNHANG